MDVSRRTLAFWFLPVGHLNTFLCDLGRVFSSHCAWPEVGSKKPVERKAQLNCASS